jgi:hypothetical protein
MKHNNNEPPSSSSATGRHVECRLEILLNVPHPNKPAHSNMQPQRGQYNNVLANDTYLVAFVKILNYMLFGLVDLIG